MLPGLCLYLEAIKTQLEAAGHVTSLGTSASPQVSAGAWGSCPVPMAGAWQ